MPAAVPSDNIGLTISYRFDNFDLFKQFKKQIGGRRRITYNCLMPFTITIAHTGLANEHKHDNIINVHSIRKSP